MAKPMFKLQRSYSGGVEGKCMGTLLGPKKVWAFQQEKDRQHQNDRQQTPKPAAN